MSDLLDDSRRYKVEFAKGEGASKKHDLQAVLDDCPKGFDLHSITPSASGSGYTEMFIVVFERAPLSPPPTAALSPSPPPPQVAEGRGGLGGRRR
jgi:hypothetical protein